MPAVAVDDVTALEPFPLVEEAAAGDPRAEHHDGARRFEVQVPVRRAFRRRRAGRPR